MRGATTRCVRLRRFLFAAVSLVLLGTPLKAAADQAATSNEAIHACYSQPDDNELHITGPRTACEPGEKSLTWHKNNRPPSNGGVDTIYKLSLNTGNDKGHIDSSVRHSASKLSDYLQFFGLLALNFLVLAAIGAALLGALLRPLLHWDVLWSVPLFRAFGPVLQIQPFDDSAMPTKFGTSFARQAQTRLGQRELGKSLYLATGEQASSRSLDALQETPHTRTLGAALALLRGTWARSRLVVSGSLMPTDGAEAAAVALTLKRRSKFVTTTEIRPTGRPSSKMTAATSNHVLAVAAAGWIEHTLADQTPGPRANEVFLSGDPQSWALFRAGAELSRISYLTEAADAYERALAIDPQNIGALIDTAHLRRREGHFTGAEILAHSAVNLIENRAKPSRCIQIDDDPNWYRAQIVLATIYLEWAKSIETADKQKAAVLRAKACKQSQAVAREAIESGRRIEKLLGKRGLKSIAQGTSMCRRTRLKAKLISQHQQRRRFDVDRIVDLHDMLVTTLEPGALLLVAGSCSKLPAPSSTKTPFEICAERASGQNKLVDDVWESREEILKAFERGESPAPRLLIEYVDLLPAKSARVLYNLACHYSMMSGRTKKSRVRKACLCTASEYLRQSISKLSPLERRSMLDRIQEDRDLEALRKARPQDVWKLRALMPT